MFNKNHFKKHGGILIENMIALLYISLVLPPISGIYIKLYKTNKKIEVREEYGITTENVVEYLENMNYIQISNKIGVFHFDSLDSFFSFFNITEKKKIKDQIIPLDIIIEKTDYFYLSQNGQKLYILKLMVNNKEFYYFPTGEDYEK